MDYKDISLDELKELAKECGLKKQGVGWPTCCPPDGNRADIIKALKKFDSAAPSTLNPHAIYTKSEDILHQSAASYSGGANVPPQMACSTYKLDMTAASFGDCVCGFKKQDHKTVRARYETCPTGRP